MYLPSQEKALAVVQCLNILEKVGELPTKKDEPLCLNSEAWSANRLLYHLSEFIDIEEPPFYDGQNEQNSLLAEETLREIINTEDQLSEVYEILLDYSQELPNPQHYQIVLPENKQYNPKTIKPDIIPNIWKWAHCQLLFVSLDCCLKDPNGKKIKAAVKTINENYECSPEAIILYNYDKKSKDKLLITDDVWYTLPYSYQLNNLSWISRGHMGIEQCLEIMEKIRGQDQTNGFKNIEIT